MAIYKLGDILEKKPEYGLNLKAKEKGKIKYIRQSDIISKSFNFFVDDYKNKYVKKGDLLISRAGSAGIPYYHESNESMAYGGYLVKYSINNKIAITKYIYFLLLSMQEKIKLLTQTGSTMPKFNPPIAKKILLYIPPLETQQKIIDIIEPIDKLKNNIVNIKNTLIILIKNLRFNNEIITIKDISYLIKNPSKNLQQVSAKVLKNIDPFLEEFEEKNTYKSNAFYAPAKTLLINTIRPYLKKFSILPKNADANGTLLQLNIKKNYETTILFNLFNLNFWKQCINLSQGTKMPIISKNDLINKVLLQVPINNINNIFDVFINLNNLFLNLKKLEEKLIKILII